MNQGKLIRTSEPRDPPPGDADGYLTIDQMMRWITAEQHRLSAEVVGAVLEYTA
jgi:hypothetical protein